jgi:hypothetical protein
MAYNAENMLHISFTDTIVIYIQQISFKKGIAGFASPNTTGERAETITGKTK